MTYAFTIRAGLRFSDGRPVTAASFAYSLNRALRPELGTFVGGLLRDVVGADDVLAGKATAASGIHARGRTLTIELRRRVGDFSARLAIGNLGAIPVDTPVAELTRAPVVSAGPYYLREYVPGRRALLARNPYWNREAIPRRPANVDAIELTFGVPPDEAVARVERGELDFANVTQEALPRLLGRFEINKGRLFVRPGLSVDFLAFNTERPLFRDNARLRRAVNFAVDRAYIARTGARLGLRRTDQILPPGMPGFVDAKIYPIAGADIEAARRLARGSLRDGRAVIYSGDSLIGRQFAEIVTFNLEQIGITASIELFDGQVLNERVARKGEPWDIAYVGWGADYLDPANFIEVLLHGRNVGSYNTSRFDEPKWNRRIDRADALTGEARYTAFAALDRDLMREAAPIVPLVTLNVLGITSARVGCAGFHAYTAFLDVVAACLR
jgi:peptide/nickel transport system substrate-binding protein